MFKLKRLKGQEDSLQSFCYTLALKNKQPPPKHNHTPQLLRNSHKPATAVDRLSVETSWLSSLLWPKSPCYPADQRSSKAFIHALHH